MWVKSSSLRCCASCLTEGRTAGGATANTSQIIHSGRDQIGLKPINDTSSSEILLNIFIAISGVIFIFFSSSFFSPIFSQMAHTFAIPSCLIFVICLCPHPSSLVSPQFFILDASLYT